MNIKITAEMTVKGVNKEVVTLGQENTKDCLKIIISDGLKKLGYKCDIASIKVESVESESEPETAEW